MSKKVETIYLALLVCIAGLFVSCDTATEIPFTVSNAGRIVVEANVNGTAGKFFWDTGAASHVNCRLDNLTVSNTDDYSELHSQESLTFYKLNEITFGGSRVKAHSLVTKISASLQKEILYPEGLDGCLGMDVFEGYWCEVSFSKGRIILHSGKPAYFAKRIPVILEGDKFVVLGTIDGNSVRFLIDTGTPNAMRFPESIIQKKTKDDFVTVLTTTIQNYHLVKTRSISVFDDTLKDKYALTDSPFFSAGMSGGTGVLGVTYLRNYNLLFDLSALRTAKTSGLYYSPCASEKDRNYYLMTKAPATGILWATKAPSGVEVVYIIKDGPLNKVGVAPKSIISKINGKPTSALSDADLYAALTVPASSTEYTLLENDKERTVTLAVGK